MTAADRAGLAVDRFLATFDLTPLRISPRAHRSFSPAPRPLGLNPTQIRATSVTLRPSAHFEYPMKTLSPAHRLSPMRKIAAAFLLVLSAGLFFSPASATAAETGSLTGTVGNIATGQNLEGAEVSSPRADAPR